LVFRGTCYLVCCGIVLTSAVNAVIGGVDQRYSAQLSALQAVCASGQVCSTHYLARVPLQQSKCALLVLPGCVLPLSPRSVPLEPNQVIVRSHLPALCLLLTPTHRQDSQYPAALWRGLRESVSGYSQGAAERRCRLPPSGTE